jgi:hypothetical protein
VGGERASSSLHERITRAVSRAARVQQESRTLIADYRAAVVALRETVDTTRREREARERPAPDK